MVYAECGMDAQSGQASGDRGREMQAAQALRRPSPRRGSRGASLVEFALILPVFVVLIFGMITGGIALSQQNSIENAVREASRFAAVSPISGTPPDVAAYLDGVITQVEDAATGDLADSVDGKEICVAFYDGTQFTSREKIGANAPADGVGDCFTDNLGSAVRTQVYATRQTEIGAIFFDVPITLESQSVSRYER